MHQLLPGFGKNGRRIFVGGRDTGNAQGVARFEKFQRSLTIDSENRILNMGIGRGVGASRHEFVPGIDDLAPGAIHRGAFHDYHIARLRHRKIWLRGHDHAKRPSRYRFQVRDCVDQEMFAQIHPAACGEMVMQHVS